MTHHTRSNKESHIHLTDDIIYLSDKYSVQKQRVLTETEWQEIIDSQ